jgi:16S rRNA processing protein RimM
VFVQLTSERHDRLDPGARLWAEGRFLVVNSRRTASNGRHVVSFEGLADRSAAERFANVALYAEPLDDTDEVWVHELIGRTVVDQYGIDRGTCISVIANPAAEILELESGALVPSNFIVALTTDRVSVDVPDGLFELAQDTS